MTVINNILEQLGYASRKVPCTPTSQREAIAERINYYVESHSKRLQNWYYAEVTMLSPHQTRSELLDRLVSEKRIALQTHENWMAVRLEGVNYIADQLADSAVALLLADEEKDSGVQYIGEEPQFSWSEFFAMISLDLREYQEAFLLSSHIDWLLSQYNSSKEDAIGLNKKKQGGITQSQRALYYVYLHTTESEPDFSNHPKGKIAAIREIAETDLISAKHFEQTYNRYLVFSNRTARRSAPVIKAVIPMLEPYPEAKEKAEYELKIASSK